MTKVERSICKSNISFAQAVEQLLLVFGSSAMNSHGSHKQRLCQRIGKSQSRAVREPGETGFTQFEYRLSGKWLELLREVAPNVTRVAVIRGPRLGCGIDWAVLP